VPTTFNSEINRFVNSKGDAIPRVKVRDEVRKLTTHVQNEAGKIAKSHLAGTISLTEFHSRMAETLKAGHLVAAAIGRGGFARMNQSDWSRVGSKIAWQSGFLAKFVNKIDSGILSPKLTNYRAGLYASALWTTYNQTMMQTMKEETSVGKNPERCRLITNSEEGCLECAADEAIGWMSVDDMGEIGSRLCGDFCKCEIEFENDDLNIEDFELQLTDAVSDELGLVESGSEPPTLEAYSKVSFQNENDLPQEQLISFARLSGVPDDYVGNVSITRVATQSGEEGLWRVATQSEGPLQMVRVINLSEKIIENESFTILDKSIYNGTQIFAKQVEEAAAQGYKHIETYAVGGGGKNGAYTWLRLGYEPQLSGASNDVFTPAGQFHRIVKQYNKLHGTQLKDVRDFMATKQGQDYWKANMKSFDGVFNLEKDSRSMKTLEAYLKERGFKK